MNTFAVKINNPTGVNQQYDLFGYNFNANQNPEIQYSVSSGSFQQLQRSSQSSGLIITSIKLITNNANQFSEALNISTRQITGYTNTYSIFPENYFEPSQSNSRVVKIKPVEIPITGDIGISGNLLPNTQLNILFTYKTIAANAAKYSNALSNYKHMRYKVKYKKLIPIAA